MQMLRRTEPYVRNLRKMMARIRDKVAFSQDKRGITALEYGIMAAFIIPVLVAGTVTLNGGLTAIFIMIGGHLTSGK